MKNFDTDFANLLSAWNHHQDLRSAHAPIAALAESRAVLDGARRIFR